MTDHPTREEINAKLEASEARLDKSVAQVLSGIDGLRAQVDSQGQILTGRFTVLEGRVEAAVNAANEAKTTAGTTKWNIFATGLTVAALAYGGFALWNQAVEVAEKSIKWLRLYGADVHREAATLAELTGGKDE